jgi:hypothetical protein
VNGHINYPCYQLRPLPTAPLVVHRRYLAVVPRPLPRCASQVLDRGAQIDSRGAAQVLDRGAQAVARGAAQVLDRGAQAAARSAACCALRTCLWRPGRFPRRHSQNTRKQHNSNVKTL